MARRRAAKRFAQVKPGSTLAERFWFRAEPADGCWSWRGSHDVLGYGRIWTGERLGMAHRAAWELANGPVPPGLDVCHRCDNRGCVNPAHLFVGTHAENMADASRKRRWSHLPTGQDHHAAKLCNDDVLAILDELADGRSKMAIGRKFGVSATVIYNIATGRTWSHVGRTAMEG